jgi:hypothetical protein
MKRTLVWWLGLVAIVGAGCGGDSGSTAACTQGTGTAQTCIEYTVSGGGANADFFTQVKMSCTQGGGVASNTCSHAGADGACRQSAAQGGVSVSLTTWFYSGTNAASEMSTCTSGGGTWIAP